MFSPDGRHVAFLQTAHHGTTLYTARFAGTTIPRPERVATRASFPSWSRDGRGTLAFVTSGCCHKKLEILPPGGGPPRLVARVKANRTLLPFWVGSQLVYESRLPPQRWPSLWTMSSAGTGIGRLTAAGGNDVDPAWSPDGSLVAFDRERSTSTGWWGSIETVRSNGSGLRLIVGGGGESDDDPSWSPDGKRIVFVRRRNQDTVSVVNADGGRLRALTGKIYSASLSSAAWSPDGKSIAYQADGDLVVMSADGTGSTTLLTSCGCSAPSWSPSGAQLAFFCASCDGGARGVAVVNADGSGLRAVVADAGSQTNLFNYPNSPVWSPDGTELLFSGTSCTTSDDAICSISLDGSGLRALTPPGVGSYAPSWTAAAG
jgi:Tol biopolymer transport system component